MDRIATANDAFTKRFHCLELPRMLYWPMVASSLGVDRQDQCSLCGTIEAIEKRKGARH
ncbi:MAG: hypothetical protein ACI9J0_000154 [Cryomorphaceae bacterium]